MTYQCDVCLPCGGRLNSFSTFCSVAVEWRVSAMCVFPSRAAGWTFWVLFLQWRLSDLSVRCVSSPWWPSDRLNSFCTFPPAAVEWLVSAMCVFATVARRPGWTISVLFSPVAVEWLVSPMCVFPVMAERSFWTVSVLFSSVAVEWLVSAMCVFPVVAERLVEHFEYFFFSSGWVTSQCDVCLPCGGRAAGWTFWVLFLQ